jgi:hypothetical protein
LTQRPDEEPGGSPALALITDDVRARYETLTRNGVTFTQEPASRRGSRV